MCSTISPAPVQFVPGTDTLWQIMPANRARSKGDPVCDMDRVMLMHTRTLFNMTVRIRWPMGHVLWRSLAGFTFSSRRPHSSIFPSFSLPSLMHSPSNRRCARSPPSLPRLPEPSGLSSASRVRPRVRCCTSATPSSWRTASTRAYSPSYGSSCSHLPFLIPQQPVVGGRGRRGEQGRREVHGERDWHNNLSQAASRHGLCQTPR